MHTEEFASLTRKATRRRLDLMVLKGREYSDETDRFVQFDRSAASRGLEAESVLWGYADKHVQSLVTEIERLEDSGGSEYSAERFNEKIADLQNYLDLLRGLVARRVRMDEAQKKELDKAREEKEKAEAFYLGHIDFVAPEPFPTIYGLPSSQVLREMFPFFALEPLPANKREA